LAKVDLLLAAAPRKFARAATPVPFRPDLSTEQREIVKRLVYVRENPDVLELHFSELISDPDDFTRQVMATARLLGVDRQNRKGKEPGLLSYHIHVSQKGQDLTEFAQLLDAALRLRQADADSSIVGREPAVAVVEPDRFQIKTHSRDFAEEVKEVAELLRLPQAERMRRLANEVLENFPVFTVGWNWTWWRISLSAAETTPIPSRRRLH